MARTMTSVAAGRESGTGSPKNVRVFVPAHGKEEQGVLKRFTSYSLEDHKLFLNSYAGSGVRKATDPEDVIVGYEDIQSGGIYVVVRDSGGAADQVKNLARWQKSMCNGQEEEAVERLVFVATSMCPVGAEVLRVNKKEFHSNTGLRLMELDAVVLVGDDCALIGEAKTCATLKDVYEMGEKLELIRYYVRQGCKEFEMFSFRRLVGCLITYALPENEAREVCLSEAKRLDLILEVLNGSSYSTENSFCKGGDWAEALSA